jgi:hypothetical protein
MCSYGISRQPRGAALVVVMLVMAVLLLAGTTFMTISSTETQIALNERAAAQAVLLAEAAIQKAIARLNANPAYGGETNTPLGGGTFTVQVQTIPGCTAVSARLLVGMSSVPVTGGTARAEVRAVADTVSYPFRWAAFATVPNGILYDDEYEGVDRIDKELWLGSTGVVDSFDSGGGAYDPAGNSGTRGNTGANGDVAIDHSTEIKGDVKAGDDIFEDAGVSVTGSKTAQANPESFPQIPPKTATNVLTVPAFQTMNLTAGTYIYKYLDLGDGASLTVNGPVTIYVTGPPIPGDTLGHVVRLGTNVTLGSAPGTQLRIITKSNGTDAEFVPFLAGAGFRFYGSLYGTNTDVYIRSNSEIYGSIIARTILTGSGTKIHYDQSTSNLPVCHNGKYTILLGTWREIIPN